MDFLNEFAKKYIIIHTHKIFPHLIPRLDEISKALESLIQGIGFTKFKSLLQDVSNEDVIYLYFRDDKRRFLTAQEKKEISSDVGPDLSSFLSRKDRLLSAYMQVGQRIMEIENNLKTFPEITYSVSEKKKNIEYSITKSLNNSVFPLEPNDALEIFNMNFDDLYFSSIIYTNNDGKKYYRINRVNRSDISRDMLEEKYPKNSLIFFFPKQKIILETENSILTITTDTPNNIWFDVFRKKFRNFTFHEQFQNDKISGKITFNLPSRLDLDIFYQKIILDPLVSFFFYVDERQNPWASKVKNYGLRFRDYNESIVIKTQYVENEMHDLNFAYSDLPDVKIKVPIVRRENGFTVLFDARGELAFQSFIYKFTRLLSYILEFKGETSIQKTNENISVPVYNKSSEQLVGRAGVIFGHARKYKGFEQSIQNGDFYKTKCKLISQPTLITEDEISEWQAYGREVAEFPPAHVKAEKRYYFVCINEENPYVYLITNKQDPDKKFPYLPCCQKRPTSYKSSSEYINYNSETPETQIKDKSTVRLLTSETILGQGQSGILDQTLEIFLNQIYGSDFNRIGVSPTSEDPNSFLYSVFYSVNKRYPSSQEIQTLRQHLSRLPPEVYKQELYDWSNEKIQNYLLDNNQFIDPYLFYRGLEIIFSVSIYVFSKMNYEPPIENNPISLDQQKASFATLELPRCRYMHVSSFRDVPAVCIYKNHGTNRTLNNKPTCELIVSNSSTLFPDQSLALYNRLKQMAFPYEWVDKIGYSDPYDTDWEHFFSNTQLGPILNQELDGYGKAIKLIFKKWILGIPPSQPLYLPNPEKIHPELPNRCEVLSFFNLTNFLPDIDGLWIPFNGNNKGIKIYCKMEISGPIISITSQIENLINMKNKTSTLMQIINWLWRSDNSPIFSNWWLEHAVVKPKEIFEEIPFPRISLNNRAFPQDISSFEERISRIGFWWPFFFYRHKIHVSPELYSRIDNFFTHEENLTDIIDPFTIPHKTIRELIPTATDFKIYDDIIFDNQQNAIEWISYQENNILNRSSLMNVNIIYEKIDPKMYNTSIPYLFKDDIGKIYIVQNVDRHYISALRIAIYWREHNKNPGIRYLKNKDLPPLGNLSYVMYIPNETGIEVYENHSNGRQDYYQIIQYGTDYYGAMLPLR